MGGSVVLNNFALAERSLANRAVSYWDVPHRMTRALF